MNIAVIGTGNIGGTLAQRLSVNGHRVRLGVRDTARFKGQEVLSALTGVTAHTIGEAVNASEVIIIAVPAAAAAETARALGDVRNKVIIDAMNAVNLRPEGFANTAEAILANCNCSDVVKCFNSTGYENLSNPDYFGTPADMFVAGDSAKAKAIAIRLAKELGFGEVYDFGGNDRFSLLEQLALCWINLAIFQKNGREISFKVLKR